MCYLKMKCLNAAYKNVFDFVFSFVVFNFVIGVIFLTFTILRSEWLPFIMTILIFCAEAVVIMAGYFVSCQATNTHLLSKKLILMSKKEFSAGLSFYDFKFWLSMKPLKVSLGGFCSFQTMEFTLFLFGDVMMKSIVDLLLTF